MSLRPRARTKARRNKDKVAVAAEEGRRRTEDNMVEVPKDKKEENLQEKGREGLQSPQQQLTSSISSSPANQSVVSSISSSSTADQSVVSSTSAATHLLFLNLENLPVMVAGVWSENRYAQLGATNYIRKLLSTGRSPPIDEVVNSGVVPRFVEFLAWEGFPQLQYEAAVALTIISSGTSENTKVLIDHGAVPPFVKLLSSPIYELREQVVYALGNIAGDSPQFRDLVLGLGALMPLLAQFNEHSKISMLRNATWTLSNFCRGKPQPLFEQIKPAFPALERLIHSRDEEVLKYACWALSYLADGTYDTVQAVIGAGFCPRLVELLLHPSHAVVFTALRTVGNIVSGDDMQTQYMINYQCLLPCLLNLLTSNNKTLIQTEACWTISNITAGNANQIQAVIEAGIIGPLVDLLQSGELDVKKEAAWAMSNATSVGTYEQIKFLVSQGCIKPLCDLLICPDPIIVKVCLNGLQNILVVGEAEKDLGSTGEANLYAQMIVDAEGLEKIANLQSHDNNNIYERAVKIVETYWPNKDDDEAEAEGGGSPTE